MIRKAPVAVMLLLLAGAVWLWTGRGERVNAGRIESALVTNGVPQRQAECMARDMAERLSFAQLRKLERLKAQDGEAELPTSLTGFLVRVRRVNDPEAIRVTARAAAICALGL